MEAILSFIVIAVLIFYLIGFIGRTFLSYWIRKKQQEFAQGKGSGPFFQWRTGPSASQKSKRPEGEVTVEKTHTPQPKVNRNVGDYVEYEELPANSD